MSDDPRYDVARQAMHDTYYAKSFGPFDADELTQPVLDAIDRYDVEYLLLRLQQHIMIPLPIIQGSEPKEQFDYIVEVIEGALKARILTAVVNHGLTVMSQDAVRRIVMETR